MAEPQNALALADPVPRKLYRELLAAAKHIGPFREEIKKTSVHLTRGSAFAGVHPRKQHLIVTIKAEKPIRSARIAKAEQVSKNRWHLDVKIAASSDIDSELLGWLRQAYALCA
ncbi:MAG TPA: DUF5655 domain-containing protein [Bryobacteraceae bacterium]|nr:DUF5655 domain-containing protein [Bryobacteraceae bacterium]